MVTLWICPVVTPIATSRSLLESTETGSLASSGKADCGIGADAGWSGLEGREACGLRTICEYRESRATERTAAIRTRLSITQPDSGRQTSPGGTGSGALVLPKFRESRHGEPQPLPHTPNNLE